MIPIVSVCEKLDELNTIYIKNGLRMGCKGIGTNIELCVKNSPQICNWMSHDFISFLGETY